MTPQEKAKELFERYCFAIRTNEDDDGYFTNIIHAKRCAKIAVEEIIKYCPKIDAGYFVNVLAEIDNV